MRKVLIFIGILLTILTSCRDITEPSGAKSLVLSKDTLSFDTVFTGAGTGTEIVMLFNPTKTVQYLERVWLESGIDFHINIDGETQTEHMSEIAIAAGDSAYIFIKVYIDPTDASAPLYKEDNLFIQSRSGDIATLHLEAIGWNVNRIRSASGRTDLFNATFSASKPWLIYDTIVVGGTLRLEAGARLYMHRNAAIYCEGDVISEGTRFAPVIIQGDRLDKLFDSVPYAYAAGQWNGFFLMPQRGAPTWRFNYTEIRSGRMGLYVYNENMAERPNLILTNSRIHNHTKYGLVLVNTDAQVANSEISNTASYCVFSAGGNHIFEHTTIASFFNHTNIRIQSTTREYVEAVYVDSINTGKTVESHVVFANCIIDGLQDNNLVLGDTLQQSSIEAHNCYLHADSIRDANSYDNVYAQKNDTVFKQNYYRYKEYIYYDFTLDSISPARAIGDASLLDHLPIDRNGVTRVSPPDAGCYQYQ